MLENRVAIVTGAARGIGAATAQLLARQGAKVAVCDIEAELTETVSAGIRAEGHEARTFLCDVSKPAQTDQLVKDVVAAYGKIDILVNNAGICPRIPVDAMTEEMFDLMFGINLKPIFFLTRAVANVMKPYQWGRVVNISSTGGRIGGVHNTTVYSGTKGGMLAMTKPLGKVSTRGAVSAVAVVLLSVILKVETPPAAMVAGLKALLRVGVTMAGLLTVKLATAAAALVPLLVCSAPAASELK